MNPSMLLRPIAINEDGVELSDGSLLPLSADDPLRELDPIDAVAILDATVSLLQNPTVFHSLPLHQRATTTSGSQNSANAVAGSAS